MATTLIAPLEVGKPIKIQVVSTEHAARSWLEKGYCPVEASFGGVSVVDALQMDHHGPLSDLEGVAIRAYRDHFGCRREDPRFVTTGFPDEDATFAMAALAGIIPHPSLADVFAEAPLAMRSQVRQNLSHVAEIINRVDLDPNCAFELLDSFWGLQVLSWRLQAHPTASDILAWYGGVDRWRAILSSQTDETLRSAAGAQQDRLEQVMSVRSSEVSGDVVVVDFSTLGRNSTFYQEWLKKFPVLVAFIGGPEGKGTITFAVRNSEVAVDIFGSGGLRNVYQRLQPGGCGGRDIIGGSSRSHFLSWEQALSYGAQLQEFRVG